jgi:hypothetical protein
MRLALPCVQGLAALPDGSFGGQTFALVASSFETPGKCDLLTKTGSGQT